MARFRMKIAGRVADVTSLFDSTRDYCRAYLTEETPHFSIAVTPGDLAFEQEELRREAVEEGMRVRTFTDPFLDRAAVQRGFARHLFDRGTLLFHGSAVAVDGRGYVFTARCGTGKSTHTRLWRELLGDRAVMINDDKPFLRITEEGIWVCGAPWSGKHGLENNIQVPLGGICILHRGRENRIEPLAPGEAAAFLTAQCYAPPGREGELAARVEELANRTPLWRMECTRELPAAQTAVTAMHEKLK